MAILIGTVIRATLAIRLGRGLAKRLLKQKIERDDDSDSIALRDCARRPADSAPRRSLSLPGLELFEQRFLCRRLRLAAAGWSCGRGLSRMTPPLAGRLQKFLEAVACDRLDAVLIKPLLGGKASVASPASGPTAKPPSTSGGRADSGRSGTW